MAVAKTNAPSIPMLNKGQLVNLEKGGRTLTNLEVLDWDETFVKFRWDVHTSPQSEIVLVPWQKIEAIGLVGER
jgi:hypothetical protein